MHRLCQYLRDAGIQNVYGLRVFADCLELFPGWNAFYRFLFGKSMICVIFLQVSLILNHVYRYSDVIAGD